MKHRVGGQSLRKVGYGSFMFQRAMAIVLFAVSGLTACGGSDSSPESSLPFVVDVMCLATEIVNGDGEEIHRSFRYGGVPDWGVQMLVWSDGHLSPLTIEEDIQLLDFSDETGSSDPDNFAVIPKRNFQLCNWELDD